MECPICIEDLVNPFKTPCCNQELHLECFNRCVNTNNKCPFCRSIIRTPDNIITIHINPIVIRERRRTNICAFCSCLVCCLFITSFISGLIGFPLGYNRYNNNKYNPNFTKFNNTLNWNMN